MSSRAIFLPGSVLPAEPAYGALLAALGPDADVVAKDLEVYADVEPPSDYSLDTEVDGAGGPQPNPPAPPPPRRCPSAVDGEAPRRDPRLHGDVQELRPRPRGAAPVRSPGLLRTRRAEQP